MTYTPVPVAGFGAGLNLRDKADVIGPGEAVDVLNVDFTERGAVKQRDGYAALTSSALTNQPDSLAAYYTSSGTKQIVVGNGNRLDAISTAGAIVASSTSPTASPHYFARFGGPGSELLFMTNGTDSMRQWNGTAFSVPAYTGTTPTGRFLAVTPWDNRLVNARRGGTTAGDSPSTVRFSDPGVPTTWGANNYVDLTPGDGEAIMGLAVWRELLFVFKETKYFVFYGTGTANDGTPLFDYQTVSNGVGLASSRGVCAARDAVYFLDRTGVYRTTRDQPQLVSDKIGPFFLGGSEQWYMGGELAGAHLTNAAMVFHDERVYCAVTTGSSSTNDRMLVYDPRYDWWSLWDIAASSLATFRPSNNTELVFGYAAGDNHVGRHSSAYTADAGSAITSRWRSGWLDFNSTLLKTVRELKLWGSGVVDCFLAVDFEDPSQSQTISFAASTLDTWSTSDTWTSSDTWGGGGVVLSEKLMRKSERGTVFSVKFSNSMLNQAWAIHRLAYHVREQLKPSAIAA